MCFCTAPDSASSFMSNASPQHVRRARAPTGRAAAHRPRLSAPPAGAARRGRGRRPRGVSRDKLLALLWPDSEAEAARHSLYQAVHAIRRSVGSDEIFLGGTPSSSTPSSSPATSASSRTRSRPARTSGRAAVPRTLPRRLPRWRARPNTSVAGCRASAPRAGVRDRPRGAGRSAAARRDHPAAVRWWRRLAAAEPVAPGGRWLDRSPRRRGRPRRCPPVRRRARPLVRQHLETEPGPAVESLARVRLRSGEARWPRPPSARPASGAATGPGGGRSRAGRDPPALSERTRWRSRGESTLLSRSPRATGATPARWSSTS